MNYDSDTSTDWLHWAKVVAILGVVTVHTTGHNAVADGARLTGLGRIAIGLNVYSLFAVPLFVMISGALLLGPRDDSESAFLRKRALRLIPALVFWHAFYFLFRVLYLDATSLGVRDYLVLTLNGRAFQALYYFWIILGLVLVTPVVRPWIVSTRRRTVALVGLAIAMLPVLTVATHNFRGAPATWIETPWTWWFFYLGFYVLGWALRDVVVSSWAAIAGLLTSVGVAYVIADNWRSPQPSQNLLNVFGKSYYHFGTLVLTVLLYVSLHSLIRPGGALRALVSPSVMRAVRPLANATLGVFALHTAIWWWLVDLPILGTERAAPSLIGLGARFVVIVATTFGIVLVVRRIPVLRKVV